MKTIAFATQLPRPHELPAEGLEQQWKSVPGDLVLITLLSVGVFNMHQSVHVNLGDSILGKIDQCDHRCRTDP